jgi:thioesterase domain-containing protein
MLGQSAGGLIVFEVARRILEAGDPEPRVLLMDSPRIYSSFGYYWGESVLHPREIVPNATNIFLEAVTRRFPAIRSKEGHTQVTSQPDDLMALNERHLKSTAAAIRSYKAEAYNGSITVMRTRQGRMMALGRRHLGWASVTRGAVRIIDVPGAHLNMLDEPYVDTVTEKLIDWLSSRQLQISDRTLTVGHSGAGYERCRDILAPGSRLAVAIRLDSAVP